MSNKTDSSSIINQDNTAKYQWADGCLGWHYLNDQRLGIIREEMSLNTSETPHYHNIAQQFFYILKGLAEFNIEGQCVVLHVGEGIHISPGQRHSIKNNSKESLEFLVISEPHAHGDRIQCN